MHGIHDDRINQNQTGHAFRPLRGKHSPTKATHAVAGDNKFRHIQRVNQRNDIAGGMHPITKCGGTKAAAMPAGIWGYDMLIGRQAINQRVPQTGMKACGVEH
jgi:hypothetical protein